MKAVVAFTATLLSVATCAAASSLSPQDWPQSARSRVEKLEFQSPSPLKAKVVTSRNGIVSGVLSPVAVYAGERALAEGGNAADAAATVALTQVTMELGSVVSYAGIFTGLYYDAATHKVYSIGAGWNSYLHEDDPATIPVSNFGGNLNQEFGAKPPTVGGAKGRQTLVPGFMAGVSALHSRFGHLPWKDLFQPAIWYCEHGVRISPELEHFFKFRRDVLQSTPGGRAFMAQAGGNFPKVGELFYQKALAKTLRGVASHGASYMYTGAWGKQFVEVVRQHGGKATNADMARYKVIWSEPQKTHVFGDTVYFVGKPNYGSYSIIPALNLAEALGLQTGGPYWQDPDTFQALARINETVAGAPQLLSQVRDFLAKHHIDASAESQLTKAYARQLAPLLDQLVGQADRRVPHHSNSIVVVDSHGNIAAITHTINTVIWGDTGIVVGGVPIPDAAGFQQAKLENLSPGARVPNVIVDAIAFHGDKPVLAIASIGASLVPESIRTLFGVLGQHQDLKTLMGAPPLLAQFGSGSSTATWVPQGAYPPEFLGKLRAAGMKIVEKPKKTAAGMRGTLSAVSIDPATGVRTAVDQPGVMVFNSVQQKSAKQ